jgi:hypothetical protein
MKYLKSFKIFESSSEDLLDIINDVFISLDDSGIDYIIDNLNNIGLIHIDIYGQSEEIDNCIKHLENYLKDLGHLYFVGRRIENETHISIENNFNKEIEKDFLEIIDGIKEVKDDRYPNSRLWINPYNYCLFKQDINNGITTGPLSLYYNYEKIYIFYKSKYSLSEINEIIRYLV